MKGKVIIIVGARGSGKSTLAKRLVAYINNERLFCYDVQNEYGLNDFEKLPEISQFIQLSLTLKFSGIIFEEATAFFPKHSIPQDMKHLLINARHDKNIVILIFHSIRSIPPDIFDLVDYVYLLRTNDTESRVMRNYDVLFEAFQRIQAKPPSVYPNIMYEFVDIFKIPR